MAVEKHRLGKPQIRRLLIHQSDKILLRTGNGLRKTQRAFVAGGQKGAEKKVPHGNLLPGFQWNHPIRR